jgi:hypothetical protein
MPTSVASAADGAAGVVLKDAARDPRFTIKAVTVVACLALICGLVYLLATRSDVQDRYTGSEALSDWQKQRDINRSLSESIVRMTTTLEGIDRRTTRIETKLDAK